MSALPTPLWASTDPDDREQLAEQVALDHVAAKVERESETAGILAELHDARHALDYIASRIDLPYYHAKAFRELLRRVRWLETEVEAAQ